MSEANKISTNFRFLPVKSKNEQFLSICKKEALPFEQLFTNLLKKSLHTKNCTKVRISFLQIEKNCSFVLFKSEIDRNFVRFAHLGKDLK